MEPTIQPIMDPTIDPTIDPIIDPNDSPLSNLDMWCDWSGVPEEPVSITIAMEVLKNQASSLLFGSQY